MSVVANLNSILDDLETEIKGILKEYSVLKFLRTPETLNSFPAIMIIPKRVIPYYLSLGEIHEKGIFEIELYQIVKTPFDYAKTTLLTDLDSLLEELYDLRHDTTKWDELDYVKGIEFDYVPFENAVLQTAVISLTIKK